MLSLERGEVLEKPLRPKNASRPLAMALLDANGTPVPPCQGGWAWGGVGGWVAGTHACIRAPMHARTHACMRLLVEVEPGARGRAKFAQGLVEMRGPACEGQEGGHSTREVLVMLEGRHPKSPPHPPPPP